MLFVMSAELIQGIISVIIVIAIIIFLVKKAFALVLCIAAILILFNVAFIWNGDAINEKLGLSQYLKPEAVANVTEFFDDFAAKRDEYGVMVDANAVYDKMTDVIDEGAHIIIDGIGQIDIGKFADTMAEKIYNMGLDKIDWDALRDEIKKQLDGIKEEDLNKVMDEIKADVNEKASDEVVSPSPT